MVWRPKGMAVTVPELQAMLDTLDRAIYSGVRSVTYRDRSTTFASVEDMRKARVDLVTQIRLLSNTTKPSFALATFSRD